MMMMMTMSLTLMMMMMGYILLAFWNCKVFGFREKVFEFMLILYGETEDNDDNNPDIIP